MLKTKKFLRKVVWASMVIFILMNVLAYVHAYHFTHFSEEKVDRTSPPEKLGLFEKVSVLFTGVNNPRPENRSKPDIEYESVAIESNVNVKGWLMRHPSSQGIVLLFHGYAGEKSSMLSRASEFFKLGFSTLLVDFMGSGESEGATTTVGFHEAEQVISAFRFASARGETHILLFGSSMGAAAILKAIHDSDIDPAAIILECPFGSLYRAVSARFGGMNIPDFPMAGLLTFWGGVQHGFWGFSHSPVEYARSVNCRTLLLYGAKDGRVTLQETRSIFQNIHSTKFLKIYPEAGHNIFTPQNQSRWIADVKSFLDVAGPHYASP